MTKLFAGHRAAWGIAGSFAVVLLFLFAIDPGASDWVELPLLVLAMVGFGAAQGSPYWRVVYRESPLRRAMTGQTDLDERELALRDRAAGLTYFLLATLTMTGFCLAGVGMALHWWPVTPNGLIALVIPYSLVAFALPVILIEWFEPSGDRAPTLDDDED
jgi:hypothetical protein